MKSSKCVFCNSEITAENDSGEHIIPNAIGGRQKIKGFICRDCNSKTGLEWDADLAKQLKPLSLFFSISRDVGNTPSQVFESTTGEKLRKHWDGPLSPAEPEYQEIQTAKGVKISIKARSIKEAKHQLKGVKRKYPQMDINAALSSAKSSYDYSEDMLKFEIVIGGAKAGRSIVKSCMALAVLAGVAADLCNCALQYLLDPEGEPCFGYYYENDLVKDRPEGIVFHCASVFGNPTTKQLLGYVEYFSILRMIVCLSDNYNGVEFSKTYALNPISGQGLDLSVTLSFPQEEIQAIYDYKRIPEGALENALHKVISIGQRISYEKERNRVIKRAWEKALRQSGLKEGDEMTQQQRLQLSRIIAEEVTPFLLHSGKKLKS